MYYENRYKAMETIDQVTRWLGIPPECLEKSSIKVEASVKPGEMVWFEAYHDGVSWELIRKTECTYLAEGAEVPEEEFLVLSQSALRWLKARSLDRTTTM